MLIGSHIQSHLLKTHLRRHVADLRGGSANLPASAVAAYDPATSRVLGATTFDGSTQYASTSSPPTSELGNGTAYVVGARFKVVAGTTDRVIFAFGDSSGSTPYVYFNVTASEGVEVNRNSGAGDDTTTILAGQSGWQSCAVRFNADGTLDVAVLAADSLSVAWVNDTTVRTLTGLDRFAVGALVRSTLFGYFDDSVCDAYFGSSATAITDAAMEAFCLGADPASAEVDAANHWPLQTDYADAIGSTDLTATGSPTQAEANADVVVLRDLTADSGHANYQANVVGGATFGAANYLSNGSWSRPSSEYYVVAWVSVPDITPANTSIIWDEDDGSNAESLIILHDASNNIIVRERASSTSVGDATVASAFSAADTPHLVVAKFDPTGTNGRAVWIAPVGGALRTDSNATATAASGIATLHVGSDQGGANTVESGTIVSKARIFLASDVSDETKFLRSLLRNWSQDVPTPVHEWTLNGASGLSDTGSAADTDLSWSASAAYDDGLVVSSHQHLLGVNGGVTWDATAGEIVGDGSTGYLRAMNAADWDTPLVVTARVEPDTVAGVDYIWSATDGTDNEQAYLARSTTAARCGVVDGGVVDNAQTSTSLVAADAPATIQGEYASTTSRKATVDGANEAENTDSSDPSGLDREVWLRREGATPDLYFDGSMRRACKHIDTADNKAARDWVEAS